MRRGLWLGGSLLLAAGAAATWALSRLLEEPIPQPEGDRLAPRPTPRPKVPPRQAPTPPAPFQGGGEQPKPEMLPSTPSPRTETSSNPSPHVPDPTPTLDSIISPPTPGGEPVTPQGVASSTDERAGSATHRAQSLEQAHTAKLRAAAFTHCGKVREHNEDRVWIQVVEDGQGLLAAVADGMGGHQAGEKAAELVVQTMAERAHDFVSHPQGEVSEPERYQALLKAVQDADAVIKEQGSSDLSLMGMGTTVVAAWFGSQTCTYLHAGDSRLYQFREGKVVYRSKDHSIVQVLLDVGQITEDDARRHPMRSQLTSCLGGGKKSSRLTAEPRWNSEAAGLEDQPSVLRAEAGDVFVLCSDGLCGEVNQDALEALVTCHGDAPETLAQALVDAALEAGGRDNITVIVAAYRT